MNKGKINTVIYFETNDIAVERKYRYAYKFNSDKMTRQKIMMPVGEKEKIECGDNGKLHES